ncbi:VIT family-domain-containing protein [Trichophaea hybrida]|nr:VIT family-domain-containing protein [Trichophaea hybrida]
MSFVSIKTLLFPRSSHRTHETSPLLPTTTTTTTPLYTDYTTYTTTRTTSPIPSSSCPSDDKPCPHPSCPRRPLSIASTSTTSSSSHPSRPFLSARTISDAIIGLSDGLTVPFALTAGLSAFSSTRIVIFGGCAELIAGSISMGLGGWLAGRGEAEFYNNTLQSTQKLVSSSPVDDIVLSVFAPYMLPTEAVTPMVTELVKNPHATVEFLMRFHHSLPAEEEGGRTPLSSACTIAAGYFVGGFVPLCPYFFVGSDEVMKGLYWSVAVMAVCLFVFGVGRSIAVGEGGKGWKGRVRGGMEMMAVGGVAAGASWGIVKALGHSG